MNSESHCAEMTVTVFLFCFFKAKKSFIGPNKSIWGPLELIEKLCPESISIATSARDMPGIKYAITEHFLNKQSLKNV